MKVRSREERRKLKHKSIRKKVKGTPERPRLFVYKSLRYLYAGLADDVSGKVLCSITTKKIDGLKSKKDIEAAKALGRKIAELAISKGIKKVVFDRSGYRYHGRVKAIADGAREGGLEF